MANDGSGAGNATSSQTFMIDVNNVNPSVPVDDDTATNEVAEGAATGTTVGIDVSSTDPNGTLGGGGVTFTLTDDAGGRRGFTNVVVILDEISGFWNDDSTTNTDLAILQAVRRHQHLRL